MLRLTAALLVVLTLAGCGDGSTALAVENRSSSKIESVQVRGPGFAAFVGDIEPDQRKKLRIYPRGEAGVGLTFSVSGQEHSSPVSGYFEPGYEVLAVVAADMTVSVDAEF
ncbi:MULTISPECIES: hypothetical protein [Luteimonas]|uniref:hypothetical protein n=1 Tax=Luteimonas TaxID=83614 RepID=UPI00117C5EB8|nr:MULTISPECIES: hypothetical protein [Luteimonas]